MKAGAISLLCNIGRIKEKDFTLSKTIFCALKRRFRILKNKKNSLSEFFCEFCGDGGKVGMTLIKQDFARNLQIFSGFEQTV